MGAQTPSGIEDDLPLSEPDITDDDEDESREAALDAANVQLELFEELLKDDDPANPRSIGPPVFGEIQYNYTESGSGSFVIRDPVKHRNMLTDVEDGPTKGTQGDAWSDGGGGGGIDRRLRQWDERVVDPASMKPEWRLDRVKLRTIESLVRREEDAPGTMQLKLDMLATLQLRYTESPIKCVDSNKLLTLIADMDREAETLLLLLYYQLRRAKKAGDFDFFSILEADRTRILKMYGVKDAALGEALIPDSAVRRTVGGGRPRLWRNDDNDYKEGADGVDTLFGRRVRGKYIFPWDLGYSDEELEELDRIKRAQTKPDQTNEETNVLKSRYHLHSLTHASTNNTPF